MATFGKTVLGTLDFEGNWIGVYTCRYQAPENGLVSKLTVHLHWGNLPQNLIGLIYADDPTGKPGALLAAGSEVTRTSDGLFDLPITLAVEAGKYYHIGFYDSAGFYGKADVGQVGQVNQDGIDSYPNYNDPFGVPLRSWDLELTIYATYTSTGPTPLQISVTPQSASLLVGQQQIFTATVIGGTSPYTVSWINQPTGEILGQGTVLTLTFPSAGNYVIFARAADAVNATADSPDIPITVTEPPPPPATHQLTVNSTPIQGIPFTIERVS
jgi:hypothetical protein